MYVSCISSYRRREIWETRWQVVDTPGQPTRVKLNFVKHEAEIKTIVVEAMCTSQNNMNSLRRDQKRWYTKHSSFSLKMRLLPLLTAAADTLWRFVYNASLLPVVVVCWCWRCRGGWGGSDHSRKGSFYHKNVHHIIPNC